jgi:hypothetical protein
MVWLHNIPRIMGRVAGTKNYKKEVLLAIVSEILLNGIYLWDQVASVYKEESGEKDLCDRDDIKRHWTEKMCTKFKKPAGQNGASNEFILHCHRV